MVVAAEHGRIGIDGEQFGGRMPPAGVVAHHAVPCGRAALRRIGAQVVAVRGVPALPGTPGIAAGTAGWRCRMRAVDGTLPVGWRGSRSPGGISKAMGRDRGCDVLEHLFHDRPSFG